MKKYLGYVALAMGGMLMLIMYAICLIVIALSAVNMLGGQTTIAMGLPRVIAGAMGLAILIGTSAYMQDHV